jgi:hypothetical protein
MGLVRVGAQLPDGSYTEEVRIGVVRVEVELLPGVTLSEVERSELLGLEPEKYGPGMLDLMASLAEERAHSDAALISFRQTDGARDFDPGQDVNP